MPLESIGTDVNINDQNEAFTVNSNFAGLKDFVHKLHNPDLNYNMFYITTIVPAIKKDPTYKYSNLM